ncbi:MAG: hypothetical protein PWP64_1616, partial [Candidatus Cloacimonadota bacterium]|nr:hypothetical protein [Candidatus Cloacimonadota bacterium]
AVADSAGFAVEGASVVLSLGSEILSRGYTDAEGNVILILPETMPAGAAQLTISAHNFKPLLHSIDIVDIASLVPGDIVIDDSQSGNNNGIISAGETVELYFGLLNTGESNLNRISGVLYSDSPWINIIQGTALYPPIQPGISTPNNNPVVIEVAADTPHETMLRLHLLLGDGATQSFDVSEFIPVESARIQYHDQELAIMGDESNILDPGETAQFNVSIINTGAIGLSNVYAELISENDLLEVVQSTADYGTLDLGVVVEANAAFQIFCREQALPGMLIPMSLRIYNSAGFEQIVPLTLTIGSATQQDPLGPDSYGYVIYDWTDSSYLEAPTYEWFEINPELGGLGTSLPISDAYNGSDEGDQVGAESLAQVSLPFVFQFYGRHYDQITVCSNGFIALGETGNAEFRNFRLPGAMGPSPMIAAFWDDLATTSSSGIYSYFDRQNRRFIIEWYHLVNGKNGSSLETFQIMLYDQNYYYTSLGDGPIKIQYQTFNNVNSQSGNEHGNYCTIGIEDHTGTRGLEYTFNNTYPTAAAELSNGTAIYITNNPSMYEAPVLQEFLAEIELHQGEKYLITNLEDYFYSEAYLSYTMQTSPFVQATQTDAGILLSFDPEFYGRIDLHIRATDPMGRYVEQEVKAIVHEASGLFEDFDTSTDLPDGWSVSHLGSTTETWQVVSNPTGGFHVQTSTSDYHSANERLNSPSFNLSGFTNTKLRFFMDYQPLANNQSKLEYSFNGFIWTPVDTFNSPFTGYKSYYLNILDNSVVRFRWTYVSGTNSSTTANHWIVDDLSITSLIPDLTSPPAVSNFALSDQSMGIVTLSWNPSYDDFFSHYEIYISQNPEVNTNDLLFSVSDDPALGYMNTSTTSISGLPHGSYWLAIRAVDLSGNSSPLSESIDFVLGAVPASVQSLHISYGESQITLTWDEVSTDISGNPMLISGYKVYGAQIPNFECNDDTLLDSTAELQYVADPDNQARFFKVTAYSE